MKKFLDEKSDLLAGIFAIFAAIAIFYEMKLADFETASIAGGIKDFAGITIDIILLVVALDIFKKKKSKESFEEKMNTALQTWIEKHSNMIVKTSKLPKGHEKDFGMSMTTDINRFYNTGKLLSDGGNGVGRFLRITEINKDIFAQNEAEITFFFNSQTYCASTDETEIIAELKDVATNISQYIKGLVQDITIGNPSKVDARTVSIVVSFDKPIIDADGEHIEKVIKVIDHMYEAMLVSARRKS